MVTGGTVGLAGGATVSTSISASNAPLTVTTAKKVLDTSSSSGYQPVTSTKIKTASGQTVTRVQDRTTGNVYDYDSDGNILKQTTYGKGSAFTQTYKVPAPTAAEFAKDVLVTKAGGEQVTRNVQQVGDKTIVTDVPISKVQTSATGGAYGAGASQTGVLFGGGSFSGKGVSGTWDAPKVTQMSGISTNTDQLLKNLGFGKTAAEAYGVTPTTTQSKVQTELLGTSTAFSSRPSSLSTVFGQTVSPYSSYAQAAQTIQQQTKQPVVEQPISTAFGQLIKAPQVTTPPSVFRELNMIPMAMGAALGALVVPKQFQLTGAKPESKAEKPVLTIPQQAALRNLDLQINQYNSRVQSLGGAFGLGGFMTAGDKVVKELVKDYESIKAQLDTTPSIAKTAVGYVTPAGVSLPSINPLPGITKALTVVSKGLPTGMGLVSAQLEQPIPKAGPEVKPITTPAVITEFGYKTGQEVKPASSIFFPSFLSSMTGGKTPVQMTEDALRKIGGPVMALTPGQSQALLRPLNPLNVISDITTGVNKGALTVTEKIGTALSQVPSELKTVADKYVQTQTAIGKDFERRGGTFQVISDVASSATEPALFRTGFSGLSTATPTEKLVGQYHQALYPWESKETSKQWGVKDFTTGTTGEKILAGLMPGVEVPYVVSRAVDYAKTAGNIFKFRGDIREGETQTIQRITDLNKQLPILEKQQKEAADKAESFWQNFGAGKSFQWVNAKGDTLPMIYDEKTARDMGYTKQVIVSPDELPVFKELEGKGNQLTADALTKFGDYEKTSTEFNSLIKENLPISTKFAAESKAYTGTSTPYELQSIGSRTAGGVMEGLLAYPILAPALGGLTAWSAGRPALSAVVKWGLPAAFTAYAGYGTTMEAIGTSQSYGTAGMSPVRGAVVGASRGIGEFGGGLLGATFGQISPVKVKVTPFETGGKLPPALAGEIELQPKAWKSGPIGTRYNPETGEIKLSYQGSGLGKGFGEGIDLGSLKVQFPETTMGKLMNMVLENPFTGKTKTLFSYDSTTGKMRFGNPNLLETDLAPKATGTGLTFGDFTQTQIIKEGLLKSGNVKAANLIDNIIASVEKVKNIKVPRGDVQLTRGKAFSALTPEEQAFVTQKVINLAKGTVGIRGFMEGAAGGITETGPSRLTGTTGSQAITGYEPTLTRPTGQPNDIDFIKNLGAQKWLETTAAEANKLGKGTWKVDGAYLTRIDPKTGTTQQFNILGPYAEETVLQTVTRPFGVNVEQFTRGKVAGQTYVGDSLYKTILDKAQSYVGEAIKTGKGKLELQTIPLKKKNLEFYNLLRFAEQQSGTKIPELGNLKTSLEDYYGIKISDKIPDTIYLEAGYPPPKTPSVISMSGFRSALGTSAAPSSSSILEKPSSISSSESSILSLISSASSQPSSGSTSSYWSYAPSSLSGASSASSASSIVSSILSGSSGSSSTSSYSGTVLSGALPMFPWPVFPSGFGSGGMTPQMAKRLGIGQFPLRNLFEERIRPLLGRQTEPKAQPELIQRALQSSSMSGSGMGGSIAAMTGGFMSKKFNLPTAGVNMNRFGIKSFPENMQVQLKKGKNKSVKPEKLRRELTPTKGKEKKVKNSMPINDKIKKMVGR